MPVIHYHSTLKCKETQHGTVMISVDDDNDRNEKNKINFNSCVECEIKSNSSPGRHQKFGTLTQLTSEI